MNGFHEREYVKSVRNGVSFLGAKPEKLSDVSDQSISDFTKNPYTSPIPSALEQIQSRSAWAEDCSSKSPNSETPKNYSLDTPLDKVFVIVFASGALYTLHIIGGSLFLPLIQAGSVVIMTICTAAIVHKTAKAGLLLKKKRSSRKKKQS